MRFNAPIRIDAAEHYDCAGAMSTPNKVTFTGNQNCPGIPMTPRDGVGCSPRCLGTDNHPVAFEALCLGEITLSVTTSTHLAQRNGRGLCHSMDALFRASVLPIRGLLGNTHHSAFKITMNPNKPSTQYDQGTT
jgi:hypothetical protein